MSNLLKTLMIFIFTALFVAGLYYGMPIIIAQPELNMWLILIASAIVMAAILSGIACSSSSNKPVEIKEEIPAPAEKSPFDENVVHVISILQKKGRLIDFLQEDISSYEDVQIGAAVRSIHKGCLEAIKDNMNVEPVMKETEGSEVTVEEGFDPSAVRLTGNVVGPPPFKGVLRHNGWRVSTTTLPQLPENQDLSIIEPAEVEII